MDKYDIVVLAGQSNAEGNGLGAVRRPYREDPRVFALRDKNAGLIGFDDKGLLRVGGDFDPDITVAREKVTGGKKVADFGLSFAREYVANGLLKDDRKLLIVNAAVGGTGFAKHQWGETAVLQERAFKMVDYALSLNAENKVVAFLWHQGEHDAYENRDLSLKTKEAYYYEKFGNLVNKFLSEYGKMPVIAGGFCKEWASGEFAEHCKVITKATKKVLKNVGGAFVTTDDLLSNNQDSGNGDNIHFCRKSIYVLGKRYFKAFTKIITTVLYEIRL